MDYYVDGGAERRLESFIDSIGNALGNRRRRASFAMYVVGLLSDGERKSMEPIASRACADEKDTPAWHLRLQHFITESPWKDRPVRQVAARYAIQAMTRREPLRSWIVDDTGFLKQGSHSVGVQRQYTGTAGKIANCQLGVSLVVATSRDQAAIDFELYLPRSWTDDAARRKEARIPDAVQFKTKVELAIEMMRRAHRDGIPPAVVLADAFYGDEPSFRRAVRELSMQYAVAVKRDLRVRSADAADRARGHPMTVGELAARLQRSAYKTVKWREGTRRPLKSRFAALRVVAAHEGDDERETEWLLIEWLRGEDKPTKFALATLPADTTLKALVHTVKERWRTERVYEDLKGELGLDHFEGRRFAGWHHHVTVTLCCYAFLIAERLRHFSPSPTWTMAHDAVGRAA